MKKGKLIAVYGINGIGKSTQIDILQKALREKGISVRYQKYPVYDLEPEGPFLNKYLRDERFRSENQISTHALQEKFAKNRTRYESTLKDILGAGESVIAEDYVGTGIVWGLTWGGSYTFLREINKNLLRPDVEILMDGERFDTAIEKGHRNEDDEERIKICRNFLLMLGEIEGWHKVDAGQPRVDVTRAMMEIIDKQYS